MLRPAIAALLTLTVLLAACQGYDYTINDRVVYSPLPLYTDFEITDNALRACIQQAVVDNRITQAAQLTALNCSHAGIADLEGISLFQGLISLKLSDNAVRNLVEVGQLLQLRSLYLENNAVVDAVPLARLPYLSTLDLSGNDALQCPRPGLLDKVNALTLPGHCSSAQRSHAK